MNQTTYSRPAIFATAIIFYHLIVVGNVPAWLGFFIPGQILSAISLTCAGLIIFLARDSGSSQPGHTRADKQSGKYSIAGVPIMNYVFLSALLMGSLYVIFFNSNLDEYAMYGYLDTKGIVLACLMAIGVLEAVRRAAGMILPALIVFFVLITVFQQYLPGVLYGAGGSLDRILYAAYAGEAGFFGQPLQIASSVIIVYLFFGAIMQVTGAGQWCIDVAMALTGRSKGGAAKAAVLSSAMFGSISGSPSSNVATTGVFTIPLMKSIGYKPAFAAAVESVASTGGQILPPVMGAIAFVMADWIGKSYAEVVVAATLPAILYYLVLFASTHFQAYKDDVLMLPASELPKLRPLLAKGARYVAPILALLYFLFVSALPPEIAGVYATVVAIVCSYFTRDRSGWVTWPSIVAACHQTVLRWVGIVVITTSVGLMIGALELSGVGVKLSTFVLELSDGNLIMTLALIGVASLILGMGLDAIPAYLTLATLMAPALVALGVSDVAAHLFVIYWGLASFFTPPMCLAVFVAISISGSRLWETGWESVKVGIAAFIIPFAFVLDEALLMKGTVTEITVAFGTAAIGAITLAAAIRGYAFNHLGVFSRIVLTVIAFVLITPEDKLIGLGLLVLTLVIQRLIYTRKNRS
jgi:TRAP transporter 4TM/12TM fusion protein